MPYAAEIFIRFSALILMAVSKCVYGTVARVVYSRLFPDRTTPQAGRLNKSPHTVHAFANRSNWARDYSILGKADPTTEHQPPVQARCLRRDFF